MSRNLDYRAGERQRKRESRRQASEAQREKNKGDIFLLQEQHENVVAAVTTCTNARRKKSEREHVRHFLQKTCN